MIKHVNNKIQNAIQTELFKAKESIKIAVAWFTNELLLQPLLLKIQSGVSVELILNDDEINRGGESSLDFTEFIKAGGILRWNDSKQLLHEKFCIIDNRIVISGSYNWTNKAEYNSEVESFFYDEEETTHFYYEIFDNLSARFEQELSKVEKKNEKLSSKDCARIDFYGMIHGRLRFPTKESYYDEEGYFIDGFGTKYSHDKKTIIQGDGSILQYGLMLKSVIHIGDFAFQGCSDLTSVEIPYGIKSIGYNAFASCLSLNKVNISHSVTTISPYAFSGCYALKEISISDSVTSIGKGTFHGCSSLERIKLPNIIEVLEDILFVGCTSLREIDLPNSLIRIGEYVFSGCSSIEYINLPESTDTIGKGAFANCTGLKEIKFPYSISDIGEEAFTNCHSLSSLELPKIQSIKRASFVRCSSLKHINIPNGIVEIEDYAFSGCSSLLAIDVPPSLSKIALNAFEGCSSLVRLNVLEGNKTFDSRNKCNAIIVSATNTIVIGCRRSKIPEGIVKIERFAFEGREPKEVYIPKSVKEGIVALSNCETIYIPKDSEGSELWLDIQFAYYGGKPNDWQPPKYVEY